MLAAKRMAEFSEDDLILAGESGLSNPWTLSALEYFCAQVTLACCKSNLIISERREPTFNGTSPQRHHETGACAPPVL